MKKKIMAVILLGLFVGTLTGCMNKNEHLQIYLDSTADYRWTNNMNLSVTYDVPRLSEKDAKKYKKLSEALLEYANTTEQEKQEALSQLEESANVIGNSSMSLNDDTKTKIMRADSRVLSLCADSYGFYGGIHGFGADRGLNFDVKTGKELQLSDVVTDQRSFFDLVDRKLMTDYPEITSEMFPDADKQLFEQVINGESTLEWTIDSEAITVYFNTYTLGPYAMGEQIVQVGFDEAPKLFNKKYTKAAKDYVIPCSLFYPASIHLPGRERERLEMEVLYNDNANSYSEHSMNVKLGDRALKVDGLLYDTEGYVVHSDDKYYLYLVNQIDDDGTILKIVDLETMQTDDTNVYYADIKASEGYTTEALPDGSHSFSAVRPFYDPSQFYMSYRVNTLSTMQGSQKCRVGGDGNPENDEPWMNLYTDQVLKTKIDLECSRVNKKGKVKGMEVIPAGSYVTFLRTDGKTWIDVMRIHEEYVEMESNDYFTRWHTSEQIDPNNEKGKIYRLYLNMNDYPYQVNNLIQDDVFDGMMFAG